ncbi:nuclease HARBI1-like protein [Perilla frutescens var. hirtella]|uniref:Nuclease HARBI1-like protein n=1 Tax=Perilla frutescens var. hirtella TaxID=608512 RepID=A0AAD4PCE0_PERFH|nr:nuclease HARBI1-like protein [Perilla frutescens var. hirtella]
MVATFLIIVGHNDRYCNVHQRFGRSHFATSQNFNKTLKALNTIAPDMMVKPSTEIPAKIQESTRFMPFFKDCIGAIDGTHIPAMVPGREVSSFCNRHGMQSQNVLAACNFDLQFMYVLSGWEGSAHDSKLLNDALLRRNGLHVPQGKYFLVDCGFANRRQFFAPLCGVRYHLKDFGGQGCHPRNASELFNLRHASLRNVIERIFGVFKSRFTIFKTAPTFPFKTQAELVLACAGLHNFLRKKCRSDEFPVEYEGDQDLPPLDTEEENLE